MNASDQAWTPWPGDRPCRTYGTDYVMCTALPGVGR
jgi:hypothetical protein